tara:strand:+ start:298 stop:633 length:336 start_codon:yes stop_codon:yes gene_type:complete
MVSDSIAFSDKPLEVPYGAFRGLFCFVSSKGLTPCKGFICENMDGILTVIFKALSLKRRSILLLKVPYMGAFRGFRIVNLSLLNEAYFRSLNHLETFRDNNHLNVFYIVGL